MSGWQQTEAFADPEASFLLSSLVFNYNVALATPGGNNQKNNKKKIPVLNVLNFMPLKKNHSCLNCENRFSLCWLCLFVSLCLGSDLQTRLQQQTWILQSSRGVQVRRITSWWQSDCFCAFKMCFWRTLSELFSSLDVRFSANFLVP